MSEEQVVIDREGNVTKYYYEVYPGEWNEMEETHVIYYRTQGGKVVHRADCPVLKRTEWKVRWVWAENAGITDDAKMLEHLKEIPWIKPCRKCLKRG